MTAQVVHVHGVAARRHVLGKPAVAAAVLAVPVDHGEHGGRLAFGAPRLTRQQKTVGGGELRGGMRHVRPGSSPTVSPQMVRAARTDEEIAARPPSSSSGSGQP